MIHSKFDLKSVETPALRMTAQRTIARLAFGAIGAALVVTALGSWAIWSLTADLGTNRIAVFVGTTFAAGALLAFTAAHILGRLKAGAATKPADVGFVAQ